jgi:hypothetical protein
VDDILEPGGGGKDMAAEPPPLEAGTAPVVIRAFCHRGGVG